MGEIHCPPMNWSSRAHGSPATPSALDRLPGDLPRIDVPTLVVHRAEHELSGHGIAEDDELACKRATARVSGCCLSDAAIRVEVAGFGARAYCAALPCGCR